MYIGYGRIIIWYTTAYLEGGLNGTASETIRISIRGKIFQFCCLILATFYPFPFRIVMIISGGLFIDEWCYGNLSNKPVKSLVMMQNIEEMFIYNIINISYIYYIYIYQIRDIYS